MNPEIQKLNAMEQERLKVSFELNDQGSVVMIRAGERTVLGPKDQVCEEMVRFLSEIDFGE